MYTKNEKHCKYNFFLIKKYLLENWLFIMDEWINSNRRILDGPKKERSSDNAIIQMNLEDMLNEISLSLKDKYCIIPFILGVYNR